MTGPSCLYSGTVIHSRLKPKKHRLRYRVYSFLLDVDEIPALSRRLRLFSHNRFNLFSFFNRDHGPADGTPLRPWVEQHLAEAGINLAGGPVRLLCYPRLLGYVFNPLSVFFCYGPDESLKAILYEVRNTFGQRHGYLIPVTDSEAGIVRQACRKEFYVSPFVQMDMTYNFRIAPPSGRIGIGIVENDADGTLLTAAFAGTRQELTDGALAKAFFSFPLLTLKVIAGIHWEALKLWMKGVPLVPRPSPPAQPVTIVATKT